METNLIDRLLDEQPDYDPTREPREVDPQERPCECGGFCRVYPGVGPRRIRSERDVVADNIRRFGGTLFTAGLDSDGHAITKVSNVVTSLEIYDSLPAWGTAEGRKAESRKADRTRHPRHAEAVEYVKHYMGSFDFLQSIKTKVLEPRFKGLSDNQVDAVCKCIDRDAARKSKADEPGSGIDLFAAMPYGTSRVAVANESGGYTFLKIDKPAESSERWHGWVFVKQQRGPDSDSAKVGTQRPGSTYKGQWPKLIAAVAADPKAAMVAYGRELGICGRCSSPLTNDTSRANGIGPICEGKLEG